MCRFLGFGPILLIGATLVGEVGSFAPSSVATLTALTTSAPRVPKWRAGHGRRLWEKSEDGDPSATALPQFTAADQQQPTGASLTPELLDDDSDESDAPPAPSASATTALFINQQTKRILIEELGYRRAEVERLRPELAQPIVEKRNYRPSEGVPEDWMVAEEDTTRAMLDKLESENKYPLKFPLLAVGTIIFGKGFGDALITIIKVNIDFPGATLTEEFVGVPVLAIDAICVVAGAALASWTWNTMRD